jgi:two-component system response regulator YesN
MYKLLIVDDDEMMREGIEKNINWFELGFQVVGTAADGEEGLELAHQFKPDIVLSDIEMPFMDGIEMGKQILESYPITKLVFLTGYDDFSYAKKALQIKACEYVLKYEDNDMIVDAVLKARLEFEKEKSNQDKEKKYRSLSLNNFLSELLVGGGSEESIEYSANILNLSLDGKRFCVAVIIPCDFEIFFDTNLSEEANMDLLSFTIKNQCDELLEKSQTGYCINYRNRIHLLLDITEQNENLDTQNIPILKEIVESINKVLKINISIYVGSSYLGYQNIPVSYNEALISAEMKNLKQDQDIISYEHIKNHGNSHLMAIKKVKEYIDENFQNELLSLNEVADTVYLASSYISTLFKKYMGIKFSEYLLNLRISKAKDMLKYTDLKTYEIAEKVGYSNSQYFSVLFKKCSRYSPTEYRQKFSTEDLASGFGRVKKT